MRVFLITIFTGVSLLTMSTQSWADGKELYEKKCAKCHALTGDGEGRLGKNLRTRPTHFNDKTIMAKLTDENMFNATRYGGDDKKHEIISATTGKPLSSGMDKFPGLEDDEIKAINQYIR